MYQQIKPGQIKAILSGADVVAVDTETTGLNWNKDKLVYLQFSVSPGEAYLVDVRKFVPEVNEFLCDPAIGKIFHSASFDVLFLLQHGYTIENIVFDTKIAAYLLNNTQDNGLKSLAKVYLRKEEVIKYDDIVPKAERAKKGELPKKRPTIADVPINKVIDYACADADNTLQLYKLFEPEIKRNKFDDLMQLELDVQSALIKMTRNGCKLSLENLDQLRCDTQKKHFELKRQINSILGEKIDIDSSKQLGEALYDNLGLPVVGISAITGAPSTDAKCLRQLRNDHKVIPLLLAYKQYEKLLSTYLDPLPALVDDKDCLHGSFNQCVTDTGRLSASNPNLQNIPVKTEVGKQFRKCFVSRFPKGKLLVIDYNQIEVRLLAHLSKDKILLDALRTNKDMHTLTASLLTGVSEKKISKETRAIFKTLNFGVIYGMSANKLSVDAAISYDKAKEYIDKFFDTYFGVKQYREQCQHEAATSGYVTTILGRRLYISSDKFIGTRALNYPIQGSAAEVIKIAMCKCVEWLRDNKMKTLPILQVHDELVFDVPQDEQALISMKIPQLMNNVVKLDVDLPVDSYLVDSWGEAKG